MRELKSFRTHKSEADRINEGLENRSVDANDVVSIVFLEDIQCYEVWYRAYEYKPRLGPM